MKRALIISTIFSSILLLTVFGLIVSQRKNVAADESHSNNRKKSCCATESGKGEISETSIFQLDSKWVTEENKELSLAQLNGKSIVMTMFFASCTYACPIIVNDMKKIEASISKNKLENTEFLLISIDPERDTPEALKDFAERYKLDSKRWTLITGTKDGIDELAAVTGFKYKKEPEGSYSHSNIINIINERGEITFQHFGLNQDLSATITELHNKNKGI
ncbi:MAG: SCO family protein [Melioribacteraceae bacterium]|nr:SCO family protein [Melioribacteraceae bacterium]